MMDTPTTTSLVQVLSDYWKEILAVLGIVGSIWGYIKFAHGKWTNIKVWFQHVAEAPSAIIDIKKELITEGGLTLRQAIYNMGGDVTKLTQLLNSETKWRRSIIDSIGTPIFEADKDGRFMWANTALLELTGMSIPDIMGSNWRNFVADVDRRNMVDGWATAVKDCTDFRVKFRLLTETGEEKIMIFNAACNKDDYGNVLGFVGKLRAIDDIHGTGSQ